MEYFATLLLSLFVTLSLIPLFGRLALRFQALDFPNERKVHGRPIPKTGGLAMAVGALVPLLFWIPSSPLSRFLLAGAALIVVFGFWDDLKDLSFRIKFGAQFCAALLVVVAGGVRIHSLGALASEGFVLPEAIAIPLTVFVIIGVTNAINLSDGLDGLAGGISLLSFICLAVLAHLADQGGVTLITCAMCGAIFGFLRFNTHPATIFMGDTGSQLLGFVGVTLAIHVTQKTLYSPLVSLLLVGFPVLDTLRVMLERRSKGKPLFVADRNHFHHKLLGLGFLHSESVLIIYFIQALFCVGALVLRFYSDWVLLGGYMIFSALVLGFLRISAGSDWLRGRQKPWGERFTRGFLAPLRDRDRIIRASFPGLQGLMALILVLTVLVPAGIPSWIGWLALGLAAALIAAKGFFPSLRGWAVRLAVFPIAPLVIYLSALECFRRGLCGWTWFLIALYALLVTATVVVLRFTRRRGYQGTPLDFLVLMIALALPVFPADDGFPFQLRLIVAAETVALFFGLEVLLVELREKYRRVEWLVTMVLLAAGVRTLLQ
ncbi:MAG: undecaprenyl/decaprenyl-phosphate alpha-N-acetylglucosaminyl 1-phosphate transferase [Deltaproteobacteria bacterium]|nr:undecaprenyl/decaprenyl-phosphate alpha-N-acetylglucosaminyl 1-phosphate transferase [Deltaproteobacteria bacterium]